MYTIQGKTMYERRAFICFVSRNHKINQFDRHKMKENFGIHKTKQRRRKTPAHILLLEYVCIDARFSVSVQTIICYGTFPCAYKQSPVPTYTVRTACTQTHTCELNCSLVRRTYPYFVWIEL